MGPAATVGAATSAVGAATSAMKPAATSAVEASSAMEPATAVEPVTAAEALTSMESSAAVEALVPAEFTTAIPSSLAAKSASTAESVMVTPPTAAVVAAPSAIVPAPVVAIEPRTYANKHAIVKIIRAVVAIRGASVGRIVIVAIRAYWWRPNIGRAKLNCDLRMGSPCSCHHHKKSGQYSVL